MRKAIYLVAIASLVGCGGTSNEGTPKAPKPDAKADATGGAAAKKRIAMNKPTESSGRTSPKLQFKWPDGERRRSYEIMLPRNRSFS